jgi:CheY-like chemotaxis protein/predicted Ser/Thr protein kinase
MARIGVLEDDDDVRELIATVLEERGHIVMVWSTVAEAREGITDFEPELLVLDVELPDGCGLDVAGTRDPSGKAIPAIILSSLRRECDILRGFVAGAVDYLTKPFSRDELLARVAVRLARTSSTERGATADIDLPRRGGLVFGRYEVERLLGHGGYGEVYLARDSERGGARVALKVLAPLAGEQVESRIRFIRETYAASRLDHPRIAGVRDVGSAQGRLYYAMDYVDGPSLHEWVAEHGPATEAQARALLRGLLEGAAALERAGIVHRDIKPDNVVLRGGRPEEPVLVDFGLAKLPFDHGVTNADFIMGTPAYLPPEVILGADAEHASDVYQVALTLRYALTCDVPFPALAGLELLNTIARSPLPPLERRVSPGLRALLTALLGHRPADRMGAQAALDRLRALDSGSTQMTRRPAVEVARG